MAAWPTGIECCDAPNHQLVCDVWDAFADGTHIVRSPNDEVVCDNCGRRWSGEEYAALCEEDATEVGREGDWFWYGLEELYGKLPLVPWS